MVGRLLSGRQDDAPPGPGRGHLTVDTGYDGWVLSDGCWDEPRMTALLGSEPDVVVSGTVENQGRFYDRFDHVVLLSAPLDVLLERPRHRATNPYGQSAEQRAEVAGYLRTVEPLREGRRDLGAGRAAAPDEQVNAVEELMRVTGRRKIAARLSYGGRPVRRYW